MPSSAGAGPPTRKESAGGRAVGAAGGVGERFVAEAAFVPDPVEVTGPQQVGVEPRASSSYTAGPFPKPGGAQAVL